jgi:putative SOS response-associated peptidase YedK
VQDYLEMRFQATFENPELFKPIYHVSAFSTPYFPIISNEKPDKIQLFQWGLIPFWVKDEKTANKLRFQTFNAKSETIFEKPSFRTSIKSKRCLVLVNGFFEWQEVKGKKYPYHIKLKSEAVFALAGIWDTWENKQTGEKKNTFSIITTAANPLLEKVHNTKKRMPVILHTTDEMKWLNAELDADEIKALMGQYDSEDMEAYTVSKVITSKGQASNVADAVKKFEYDELKYEQKSLF